MDNVNVTIGDQIKDQRIQDNIAKNAELEEKIAALKAQFNDRATHYHGSTGQSLMKVAGVENEGDERYQDQFYRDMTDFYDHNEKHDSPTKRLVKQKTITLDEKLANPELKH